MSENENLISKLVLVEWEDSCGCSSDWGYVDEANQSVAPVLCRSVGWLLVDNNRCKVVVPHLTEEDHERSRRQGCGDMTIPTSSVRSIKQLRPGRDILRKEKETKA